MEPMAEKTYLVSIIIPVFKVEPYLKRCLDSVICQTYRNLEILLVDDGSPDRCGIICDEYAAKDSRIIVLHQENKGVSEARNAALNIARGDYFMCVDSDDWIEEDTCETALNFALNQQADIVCFGFKVHSLSGETRIIVPGKVGVINKSEMIGQLLDVDIMNSLLNKMFSKDLFKSLRLTKGRYGEDMDIMYKIIHQSHTIYLIDTALYHYCKRKESFITQRYQAIAIKSRILIFEERLPFIKEHYPEYANKQAAQLLRELILGKEWLKGDLEYSSYRIKYHHFIKQYRYRIKDLKQFNRLIGLYYYCRPLALFYEKGRHLLYLMGFGKVLE